MSDLSAPENTSFQNCEICGGTQWTEIYRGRIRDGKFGHIKEDAIIARCNGCGADRLNEASCLPPENYEDETYWSKVDAATIQENLLTRDHLQPFNLRALETVDLDGISIADVGCASGSFLNHVKDRAGKTIAIEPARSFHDHLQKQGHIVFPYADDAARTLESTVDLVTTFQVIEHVENPRDFLAGIKSLLSDRKGGGRLLVSTPNRDDILTKLLPGKFHAFFYRVVHRWYFDAPSLQRCAEAAGYAVDNIQFIHRYGLSNTLRWLRDHRPTGDKQMDGIDGNLDDFWKSHLERNGTADTLYMTLRPR